MSTSTLPAAGIPLPQIPQAPPAPAKNGKSKKAAPAPAAKNGKAKPKPKAAPPAPAVQEADPQVASTIVAEKAPVELHQNLLTGKFTVVVNDPALVEVVVKQ